MQIDQLFRSAQSSIGNMCMQQHHAFINNKPLEPFFSRTVGGWGQLKLPVIQFGSVAPQGLPPLLQTVPERSNEELKQTIASAQPPVSYQRTSANKRQRLTPPQTDQSVNDVQTRQNQSQPVTFSNGSQAVMHDTRQYVVAKPQSYYSQQQGYDHTQHNPHYSQMYGGQQQYPQQFT